jgi:hypothetical protein
VSGGILFAETIHNVFYRGATWSLTLREEGRLREFENSMLKRIFGPKRDEMIGGAS